MPWFPSLGRRQACGILVQKVAVFLTTPNGGRSGKAWRGKMNFPKSLRPVKAGTMSTMRPNTSRNLVREVRKVLLVLP
jgi:hypothetical protein